ARWPVPPRTRPGGWGRCRTRGCPGLVTHTPTGSRTRRWTRRASPARGGRGPARGQATTTLLLRHGQTALSAERRFAGRGDIPLTEAGVRQAAAAARRLAGRGGIDVIVTSPLQRARRTAQEVARATG